MQDKGNKITTRLRVSGFSEEIGFMVLGYSWEIDREVTSST
jgi:hypothetical protein